MRNLFLVLLIFPHIAAAQIEAYKHQNIEGFNIYVEVDALNNHEEVTLEAINFLAAKLKEINKLGLKSEIIDSLQSVKIFMSWNSAWPAMGYHPSRQWLVENGHPPEKEKSIEISNIQNFLTWSRRNQPFMVLHELAHAYHHRVLGFDYPPIIKAYENALDLSLYDSVSHLGDENYTTTESYAKSNKLEYFAELSESYLGQNDFYPFNRSELKQHDPKGYEVLESIWRFEENHELACKCKLPRVVEGPIALGFPKVAGLAPSIGKVNMTVLFVDFEDVPAGISTDSVFSIINPIAADFLEEVSYGRMELKLTPYHRWLRLSKPSEHYGKAIFKGQSHLNFIQEAVDLVVDEVDFRETDIVLIMSNPEAKAIAFGPVFKSIDSLWHIKAPGASISVGITSGFDLNHWGGLWLAHEIGHTLGLPDLYDFDSEHQLKSVGTFGIMGTQAGNAPGHFAFERWVLGWLDDDQIFCHESGETIVEIEAIENKGGTKAIMVPLDSTSALVVESRRKIGVDIKTREGALVYLVNTSLPGGHGPIQVKPGVKSEYKFLQDAPMVKGDTYNFKNIFIEVLESNKESDKIKVVVK